MVTEYDLEVLNKACINAAPEKYDTVTAEYLTFNEFKVQYTRRPHSIHFRVSDYMVGAPYEVIKSLFSTMFARFDGVDAAYEPCVINYLLSKEFRDKHRDEFIRRNGMGYLPAQYTTMYRSLMEVPDHDIAFMVSEANKPMVYSALFRTIAINEKLLDEENDVPMYVVEYLMLVGQVIISHNTWPNHTSVEEAEAIAKDLYDYGDDAQEWIDTHLDELELWPL